MFRNNKTIQISITTNTIIKTVVIVVATVFVLTFIKYLARPLQLIGVSAFLAIALNPAVSWLTRKLKSQNRTLATAAAYSVVLLVIAGFLAIVIPPLVSQAREVASGIPLSVDDINNQSTPAVRFIREHNLTDQYSNFVTVVRSNLQTVGARAVGTVSAIGTALLAVLTVLIMTFMMLVEAPQWIRRFWQAQNPDQVEERKRIVGRMYRMFTGYVNGQLLIATIAATFALVAMLIASTIFGVTINVVALALVVGLIGLIPMIGNTLAAIIVVVVCLFVSVPLAITMAVFFLVYQQVENATLQPMIQSKYNELTPLTVFIAALLGVAAGGFLGALVAIPVAGCLKILLLEVYGHKFTEAKKATK